MIPITQHKIFLIRKGEFTTEFPSAPNQDRLWPVDLPFIATSTPNASSHDSLLTWHWLLQLQVFYALVVIWLAFPVCSSCEPASSVSLPGTETLMGTPRLASVSTIQLKVSAFSFRNGSFCFSSVSWYSANLFSRRSSPYNSTSLHSEILRLLFTLGLKKQCIINIR